MWYPNDEGSLRLGDDIPAWKDREDWRLYPTEQELSRIHASFVSMLNELGIEPPQRLYKFGKVKNDQGYDIVYSLTLDNEGEVCLNYAIHHKMHTDYGRIKKYGDFENFDIGDDDDSMFRLFGIADNWEYKYEDSIEGKEFEFFWETESPFSQWHKCEFFADGLRFVAAEQYMMFHKAMLFGDRETAMQIMSTNDVRKHKELGRKVKNFNDGIWALHRRRIVYEANKYKFTQNPWLFEHLIRTGDKILVEASPYDKIWGVGMAADNADITDPTKWLGKNYLGFILTMLREDLKYCLEYSPEWLDEPMEDIPLNEEQYQSLKVGFAPDWDFRYEPRFMNGWHYISRSGFWVKKFKYELQDDGLYHLTMNYTSVKEGGRNLLVESFLEGYYRPPIWTHQEKIDYCREHFKNT